jgi:hypothetical protein
MTSPLAGSGVLPELVAAEEKLRALATAAGLAYTVNHEETGGYVRTQADTAAYMRYRDVEYANYVAALKRKNPAAVPVSKYTWRPIAAFGSSWHNFGAAFDVTMVRGTYAALGALAAAAGLVWGGLFPAARKDIFHFQLPGSILDARAKWLARGNAPGAVRLTTATKALTLMAVVVLGAVAAHYGQGWKI